MELTSPHNFLRFEDVVAWPLSGTLFAILFLLGIYSLSNRVSNKFLNVENDVESAILFFTFLGVIGSLLCLIAQFYAISFFVLRVVAAPFILLGIACVWRGSLLKVTLKFDFSVDSFFINLALLLYFLCALAPVTDADSIAYHMAVPMEILRSGHNIKEKFWLHAQLIGTGEYLNLLALGLGTSNITALINFSSLYLLVHHVGNLFKNKVQSDFSKILILCIPVFLFLLPSQKPQLSGTVALILSYLLIKRYCHNHRLLSPKYYPFLIALGLIYPIGIKYSFVIPAAIFILLYVIQIKRDHISISIFLFGALLASLVELGPLMAMKWINYGSPVAPLLYHLFGVSTDVSSFLKMLRTYRDNSYPFPFFLLVPDSFSTLSTVIGVPLLGLLLITNHLKSNIKDLILVLMLFLASFLLMPPASRFYLEASLVAVIVITAVGTEHFYFVNILKILARVQLTLSLLALMIGVWTLTPGILTDHLQKEVWSKRAFGYDLSQKVSKEIPHDASIISDQRPILFSQRITYPSDYLSLKEEKKIPDEIQLFLKTDAVYLVTSNPKIDNHKLSKWGYVFIPFSTVETNLATRNPLNKTQNKKEPIFIYRIKDGSSKNN